MKFHIPFTFSEIDKLKKKSNFFSSRIMYKKKSKLGDYLESSEVGLSREEYLGIVIRSFLITLVVCYFVFSTLLLLFRVSYFYIFGAGIAVLFSAFIFFSQMIYPKIFISRKQRNIERNLIPALQDMLVQLNSGIPLFDIMVNISAADYGVLSSEFRKAVKRINAGESESEVLNDLGKKNPSIFFRRTLWQMSNGMNSGSDISIIIKDSINSLNEEQLIQLQTYGNKLNPMIVLYMLISVIVPSLSVAFLTIISSLINLPKNMIVLMFISLLIFDVLIQIIFLGVIKSKKPSLI
ncbi:MAG: type II secretion system F family protein [Candidatus Pacearchaeota archaeon]